jgi:phosphoribosylformylglycinamidine (FGAM) synthase-like enzyme
VAPAKLAALQGIARQYGVAASEIGQVTQDPSLRIEYKGRAIIDSPVENLRDVWGNSLERTIAERTK